MACSRPRRHLPAVTCSFDVSISFVALADDVPLQVRVRGLLKYALRARKLRCVDLCWKPSYEP